MCSPNPTKGLSFSLFSGRSNSLPRLTDVDNEIQSDSLRSNTKDPEIDRIAPIFKKLQQNNDRKQLLNSFSWTGVTRMLTVCRKRTTNLPVKI
jgi:hypothetical protein